jgi:hypothetical protein
MNKNDKKWYKKQYRALPACPLSSGALRINSHIHTHRPPILFQRTDCNGRGNPAPTLTYRTYGREKTGLAP